MDITFNIRDSKGEIEIVFGVKVLSCTNLVGKVSGEIEIKDVCVNGSFVPRKLEDKFIEMVGLEEIEQRALEREAS